MNPSPGPRKTKKDGKKNTINFMKSNLKPLASVPEINLVEEKFALQNLPTISQNNAFPTPRVHESLTSSSQRQLLTQRSEYSQKEHPEYERLLQYTKNLESKIHLMQKDMQRYEYLNKFLVQAHQNREEAMRQLVEENRALRLSLEALKDGTQADGLVRASTLVMGLPIPYKQKPSGIKHIEQAVQKQQIKSVKSARHSEGSRILLTSRAENRKDFTDRHMTPATTRREKSRTELPGVTSLLGSVGYDKSMSFLRFTEEKEAAAVFFGNDDRILLKKLVDQEEQFVQNIRGMDNNSLLRVHTAIGSLLHEGTYLLNLVFRLKQIISATRSAFSSLELESIFRIITDQICISMGCHRAKIFVLDQYKEELWTIPRGIDKFARIPLETALVVDVIKTGRPITINDISQDKRYDASIDIAENYKTKLLLYAPMFDANQKLIGVVQAFNKNESERFTKDDESLLLMLGEIAGIMISNSLFYDKEKHLHGVLKEIIDTGTYLSSLFGSKETIIQQARLKLQHMMSVKESRIYIYDKDTDCLTGPDQNDVWNSYPKNIGIAGQVFQTGIYEQTLNPYNHELFDNRIDMEIAVPMICWPIKIREKKETIYGVIEIPNIKAFEGLATAQNVKPDYYLTETLEFFSKQLAQTLINNEKFIDFKQSLGISSF